MFYSLSVKDAWPIVILKRATQVFLALCFVTALVSGHRAYFQVRSLELQLTETTLHDGTVIQTTVVSSGRTHVDVRVELIQGTHVETLAVQRVLGNDWGAIDPRQQHGSQSIVLTSEFLERFQAGTVQVRATATGRPQWTRLPPPVVREASAEIRCE
jgi:hypothetical protein